MPRKLPCVAARKATPKGDFQITLARLTVSNTAPLGTHACRSVLGVAGNPPPPCRFAQNPDPLMSASLIGRLDIGTDGELATPQSLPPGFDINAAFAKCVWFRKLT